MDVPSQVRRVNKAMRINGDTLKAQRPGKTEIFQHFLQFSRSKTVLEIPEM
jgi:hypothetical protein